MHVEIYSDVVCPWCYIGKRRFEAALERLPYGDTIEVTWLPFQLDPNAPLEPSRVVDAYARKFGGPERARQIMDHLTSVAASVGLDFHLDQAWRSNTFEAHRLLWFAQLEGGGELQTKLKERLLRAYFSEGEKIGDDAVLTRLAGEAGLDRERVAAFLASDEGIEEVSEELALATQRGVSAVPTFVIDGRWAIPGAQETDIFVQVIERVREQQAATNDEPRS